MIANLSISKIALAGLITGLFFFTSCKKVDADNGPRIDQRIETEDFNKIVLHTGGHLNYKQGSFTQVDVSTTQEVLNALNFYVEDNTLHIKSAKGYKIKNQDEITFNITDDDTYSIEVCGSGDINADFDENYYFTENILKISGSGDINADAVYGTKHTSQISGSGSINVNQVNVSESNAKIYGAGSVNFKHLSAVNANANISGSGSIIYQGGQADVASFDISGSGSLKAYPLYTIQTDIKSSGSGTAYVTVEHLLNSNLSGSGSVYYKGYPNLATAVSGSGNVFDAN